MHEERGDGHREREHEDGRQRDLDGEPHAFATRQEACAGGGTVRPRDEPSG